MTKISREKLFRENFKPKKHLGQHFLRAEKIMEEMLKTANITSEHVVVEVGAGSGNLTFILAPRTKKVFAIEKDGELVNLLRKNIIARKTKNIAVIEQDILSLPLSFWRNLGKKFIAVGNIPYYLTGKLFRKIFELPQLPDRIVFMVQHEVAKRIVALKPQANLLGSSIQAYGEPRLVKVIKKGNFWPKPKVDSAIILVKHISRERFRKMGLSEEYFFKVLKASFLHKRKILVNSLAKGLGWEKTKLAELLKKAHLPFSSRAQELNIEEFFRLAHLAKGFK